jgi:hypothetical protein
MKSTDEAISSTSSSAFFTRSDLAASGMGTGSAQRPPAAAS